MYAGDGSRPACDACLVVLLFTEMPGGRPTSSMVAGTGREVSNGEVGFKMRVTQKHLATPSSPLINVTFSPRSLRSLKEPLSTQDVLALLGSAGAESIWLIKSNAGCRSCRDVRLKTVMEHTSCLE